MKNFNFLGIGAAKSGTTWLAEVLRAHPQIFLPPQKEITFFSSDENYAKGLGWYLNVFRGADSSQIKGEFSVSYLRSGYRTAKRIYKFNKQMKLIIVVRNPVDRAVSHYRWFKQMGERVGTFTEEVLSCGLVNSHSMYYQNISQFLKVFPRNQFFIIRYEDIEGRPEEIQRSIYKYLEVDHEVDSGLTNNVIGKTINPRFRVLETLRNSVHGFAKNNNLNQIISFVKNTGLSNLYRKLNDSSSKQLTITSAEKETAYNYFREDTEKFGKITGIDISGWLK